MFKYLIKHVSWYGPVYLEAGRMEEKIHEYERAIEVVEQGPFSCSALMLRARVVVGGGCCGEW